jgi:hypothetical protein
MPRSGCDEVQVKTKRDSFGSSAEARRLQIRPTRVGVFDFIHETAACSVGSRRTDLERRLTPGWCDKLASTPTVGFRLSPRFRPASNLLEHIGRILDDQVKVAGATVKPTFTIERLDQFDLSILLRNGFRLGLSPTNISVTFIHGIEMKPRSGELPTIDFLTEAQPYTTILPGVCEQLLDLTLLLPETGKRRIATFGVVSTTLVNESEMPPGLLRLIERVLEPWGQSEAYSLQITSKVGEAEEYYDRCIHTLTRAEDKETVPTINLDWQRIFRNPRPVTKNIMRDIVAIGTADALTYFERLGEGAITNVR